MLNDYDTEGWRNMAHSDDRPFQTHSAILNTANTALESKGFSSIRIDFKKSEISIAEGNIYRKVR